MTGNGFEITEELLADLRHRLFDVAADLQPLPTIGELGTRVAAVAAELHRIERELLMVVHLGAAGPDIISRLEEIDGQLAAGWKPEGSDVGDVVDRLRSHL